MCQASSFTNPSASCHLFNSFMSCTVSLMWSTALETLLPKYKEEEIKNRFGFVK